MNMTVTDGNGIVNGQLKEKGDHFILPNGFGNVELRAMQIIASHDIKQNRYLLSEEETAIMCISNEQCQTSETASGCLQAGCCLLRGRSM